MPLGGYIQAEIVNHSDEVYPGFSRQECDAFSGDTVKHTFSWRGKTDFPVEQRRKIRFYLRNARVYTFKLEGMKDLDLQHMLT